MHSGPIQPYMEKARGSVHITVKLFWPGMYAINKIVVYSGHKEDNFLLKLKVSYGLILTFWYTLLTERKTKRQHTYNNLLLFISCLDKRLHQKLFDDTELFSQYLYHLLYQNWSPHGWSSMEVNPKINLNFKKIHCFWDKEKAVGRGSIFLELYELATLS